ncbi:hypothetical protein N9023_07090 [Opitutaceae bacterium]|nr:hypothetical protein [Opitutaceae bacterium]
MESLNNTENVEWTPPQPLSIEALNKLAFAPSRTFVEVTPRFSCNGIKICTSGNLTAILAQAKTGKSAFMAAMIAAAITKEEDRDAIDTFGIIGERLDGRHLLHFDTEQSPADHHKLIKRTLKRAHLDQPPPNLQSFCLTGLTIGDRRQAATKLIKHYAEIGGIHSVFIDGIGDLCGNVNDAEVSDSLLTEMTNLAINHDCPIICVLHQNPNSANSAGKMRGHLGSSLERKAETNLILEKNAAEITTVYATKTRNAPILKNAGPAFEWDDYHGMHRSTENPNTPETKAKAKAETEHDKRVELVTLLFPLGSQPMNFTDLTHMIMRKEKRAKSTAEKRIKALVEAKLITKTEDNLYSPSVE